jgi:hypothetical protein
MQRKDSKEHNPPMAKPKKEERHEVYVKRDFKDYLGESLLIVFSVLLALIVTEAVNTIHENQQIREVLQSIREELINNKKAEEEQYQYHLMVLKNIDSALTHPSFAQQFISDGRINLNLIAPQGVLLHDLNDVAWQAARQRNIASKIDLTTYSLLTDIYDNQQRITNSEQEIAHVLLSRESRTAADNRITLILLHDNYHGWAVDRVPKLLKLYQQAINKLSSY